MSGQRPTLRHGLPYRWWTRQTAQDWIWGTFTLGVVLGLLLVLEASVIGLWRLQ